MSKTIHNIDKAKKKNYIFNVAVFLNIIIFQCYQKKSGKRSSCLITATITYSIDDELIKV